jgi:hypothetical protein
LLFTNLVHRSSLTDPPAPSSNSKKKQKEMEMEMDEEGQIEEDVDLMEQWKETKRNLVALLVGFKRVYEGKNCSVSLQRSKEKGYVFTTNLSEKVMGPLLSLVSGDFDGRTQCQKQPRKFSTEKEKKKGNPKVESDSEEEEEDDFEEEQESEKEGEEEERFGGAFSS